MRKMSHNQAVQVKINDQIQTLVANPAVTPKGSRRRFPLAYKLKVLAEAEACQKPGELGALLRREGLYDSHLSRWRAARRAGEFGATDQPTSARVKTLKQELAALQTEQARLQKSLAQAELVIDVQKKLSLLLGLATTPPDGPPSWQ
jgi:transposase-like protein